MTNTLVLPYAMLETAKRKIWNQEAGHPNMPVELTGDRDLAQRDVGVLP